MDTWKVWGYTSIKNVFINFCTGSGFFTCPCVHVYFGDMDSQMDRSVQLAVHVSMRPFELSA